MKQGTAAEFCTTKRSYTQTHTEIHTCTLRHTGMCVNMAAVLLINLSLHQSCPKQYIRRVERKFVSVSGLYISNFLWLKSSLSKITKEKLKTPGRIHLEMSGCSQLKSMLEPAEWSEMSTNYFQIQFLHLIWVFLLTLKTKSFLCSAREANHYTAHAAQVLRCSVQSHVLVYRLRSAISYPLSLFCLCICAAAAAAEALGSATGGVLLN